MSFLQLGKVLDALAIKQLEILLSINIGSLGVLKFLKQIELEEQFNQNLPHL